jgi:hypothetical protein
MAAAIWGRTIYLLPVAWDFTPSLTAIITIRRVDVAGLTPDNKAIF